LLSLLQFEAHATLNEAESSLLEAADKRHETM
jgi:hypothetical protein